MAAAGRPESGATGPTFPSLDDVTVADAVRGPAAPDRVLRNTHAVAEALFTTRRGPPPQERLDFVARQLGLLLTHAGARARFVYRACLLGVSWLAPLTIGRLPPFRRLSPKDRVRALERAERGRLGLLVLGVKTVLCILYYEHPDSAREAGFDGRCLRDEGSP